MNRNPGKLFCLLLLAAGLLVAADYKIQIRLQEFTLPVGTTAEQIITGRMPLKELVPGDVLIFYEVTMTEERVFENKVRIDRTEVEVRYRTGKEAKNTLPLGIHASFNKRGRPRKEESFSWLHSCTALTAIPIGKDTILGVLESLTNRVKVSIIRIEKVTK